MIAGPENRTYVRRPAPDDSNKIVPKRTETCATIEEEGNGCQINIKLLQAQGSGESDYDEGDAGSVLHDPAFGKLWSVWVSIMKPTRQM